MANLELDDIIEYQIIQTELYTIAESTDDIAELRSKINSRNYSRPVKLVAAAACLGKFRKNDVHIIKVVEKSGNIGYPKGSTKASTGSMMQVAIDKVKDELSFDIDPACCVHAPVIAVDVLNPLEYIITFLYIFHIDYDVNIVVNKDRINRYNIIPLAKRADVYPISRTSNILDNKLSHILTAEFHTKRIADPQPRS